MEKTERRPPFPANYCKRSDPESRMLAVEWSLLTAYHRSLRIGPKGHTGNPTAYERWWDWKQAWRDHLAKEQIRWRNDLSTGSS